MLTLNIIPEELKKENKIKNIFQSLQKLMIFIILLLLIYVLVLQGGKLILQDHYNNTIEETTLLSKNTENYDMQVDNINSQIKYMESIHALSIPWTYLLEFLSNNLQTGITVTKLHFNKTNNTFLLMGNSKTKQGITDFIKILETSDYFSDIISPQNNFWQKNDVSFEIKANFTSYEFNK
jgi:hypothetical protein